MKKKNGIASECTRCGKPSHYGKPCHTPEVLLEPAHVKMIEQAFMRGLDKIRTGGTGRYVIPFNLGIPNVRMSVVIERTAVKLRVVPPPPKNLIVPG